jgi:Fe-S-cluster containining protein
MSFLESFLELSSLKDTFLVQLHVIQATNPTARDQGKQECCRSGVCCWRRPGHLDPADVPRIAAYLGLSEKELFNRYLIVDILHDDLCLLPKRSHQEGGRMIGWRETFSLESPCVFLDVENGNACKVHPVKPKGCSEFKCWEEQTETSYAFPKDGLMKLGWDGYNPDDSD